VERQARVSFLLGGWLTVVTGSIHGLLTVVDAIAPTFLIPTDGSLLVAMQESSLELVSMARDSTTVWRAWLGFNLAFAIGACFFGLVCVKAGEGLFAAAERSFLARYGMAVVSTSYAGIAALCWFYAPAAAFSIAAVFILRGTWLQRQRRGQPVTS
jgi:hypothetical protein